LIDRRQGRLVILDEIVKFQEVNVQRFTLPIAKDSSPCISTS
jgi:hypothetical protein